MLVSFNAVSIFAQGLDQLLEPPVEFPDTVALKWSSRIFDMNERDWKSRINEETRAGSHDPALSHQRGWLAERTTLSAPSFAAFPNVSYAFMMSFRAKR
jgi:hypothetical protein